ncbi:hypothetical protein HIV01_008290 [Lysobacter arenosi]|uniref:Serine/threonine protein kinase n=1 Tax=Lysobacter arenosi TaxID=2795387 RepID=A0ABX7RGC0_9GAMM|nr:hypothetical protein [Lysobacter arenosi]QSX76457.1 hypothetical protein HIV01_008290 [Lysobacter arenosi]
MELDELKLAWQTLDRRLEQQTALNLQLLTETRIDKVRSRLRPLWFGQVIQLIVGVLLTVTFANFWIANAGSPALLASGLLMHAWSVALIISAVMELLLITRIDYAGPVLTIQKSLAQLRLWRTRVSPWLGLPFWLLWMPLMAIAFKQLFGAQMHASVYYIGIPIGIVGMLATVWFHFWAHRPERRHIGEAIDAGSAGRSVTRAQQYLDEIAQFGKE